MAVPLPGSPGVASPGLTTKNSAAAMGWLPFCVSLICAVTVSALPDGTLAGAAATLRASGP